MVTTGIRQILDKYELLEKVGQGGMAIVYRGRDTTLRREVAVKVLHRHLADHKEARDRFEREAQAVAKLRHENILEIFDFSGVESEESYIVTEFIDGQTLKQFTAEHEIRYPEIGAMITVQICRALGHAHSLGVLHRDVKPENIMIRNDGVVKLTDFGIAQMLDHQRLTVTGQLLGSPAYMSPEHVEGGKLDFRTDVFAAGIVLYQLATGELPFRGKNPHEILKRIAECSYVDPRQVSPLIGNELAGIIRKSLAHDKDDRFADVSQMVAALEAYLAGSGLGSPRDELARFFNAPVSYEMALRPRLVAALSRRGLDRLGEDRNAALEVFNRVLTMDPDNAEVLAAIERLSRQRRWVRVAAIGGGLLVVAVGGFFLRENLRVGPTGERAAVAPAAAAAPLRADAGVAHVTAASASQADAGAGPATPPPRAAEERPRHPGRTERGASGRAAERRTAGESAPSEGGRRAFTLNVSPMDSQYSVDGGAWQAIEGSRAAIEVGAGEVRIAVRNRQCCVDGETTIPVDRKPGPIDVSLHWLPASVTPRCDDRRAMVRIGTRSWKRDSKFTIPVKSVTGTEKVKVTFFVDGTDKVDDQEVDVHYGEDREVLCRF
ncbi:MAG TPA: serine/threonine-protein kinase [Kofleriaceae bacterium]|nr:serine/threonine-protein kinase [Kofleriaceae bacterium]